jgi:hypothetical protein
MARRSDDENREETLRLVSKQTERTSRACSLLFQSWMHLGSQLMVGSAEAVATTLRDLNDLYCDPRGGLAEKESDTQRSRRRD